MKLNRKDLLNAFASVASLTGGPSTLPILASVRLTVEGGALRITASNLDCHASAVIDCQNAKAIDLCVNAKTFGAILKSCGEDIEIKHENNRLHIESNGSVKLATRPGEEHVPWPKEEHKALGVNVTDLSDCIESVAWAASDKPEDGTMQNVWVKTEAKAIQCAASDRKCLGYVNRPAIAAPAEIVFAAAYAARIVSALRIDGATVSTSEKHLFVESPSFKMALRLSEDRYPNVLSVVNQDWRDMGDVDPAPLIEAVQVARTVAAGDPLIEGIHLDMDGSGIRVIYKGGTGEYQKLVPAKLTGTGRVLVSSRLMPMVLAATETDKARLKVSDMAMALTYGNQFNGLALMLKK